MNVINGHKRLFVKTTISVTLNDIFPQYILTNHNKNELLVLFLNITNISA